MSEAAKQIRKSLEHSLDAFAMISWNNGYEAAINAIDELSNELHNSNDTTAAEILRWTAKELRGENAEAN